MKTIFVVDDNDINLSAAESILSTQYRVFMLPSALAMFELLKSIVPDLILLDIIMPEMDGFAAIKFLKSHDQYKNIPVIFITALNDSDTESCGFEQGAVDFVSKPFSTPVLLNRIKTHLNIDGLIRDRTTAFREQMNKYQRLKDGMISVLADMLERRDKATGGHVERTTEYMRLLTYAMLKHEVYANEMNGWDLELVITSTRLHDVGKIAISDLILNKPESLTAEEFETMKLHAAEGVRIIEKIISQAGDDDFLLHAKLVAGYHHERWDGKGYPCGLKGTDIPLQGRIMAIVDVYDALTSDRSYKSAFTHEEAVQIIIEGRGRQFEPEIVDVFLEISDEFTEVRNSITLHLTTTG